MYVCMYVCMYVGGGGVAEVVAEDAKKLVRCGVSLE